MAAKKSSKKPPVKKTAPKKNTTRRPVEVEDDEEEGGEVPAESEDEEDSPVGRVRGSEEEEDEIVEQIDRPVRKSASERIADLDELEEAEEEVGITTRTTTEKNSLRQQRLNDLVEDGTVERNRTITGQEGRGRSIPTKADKRAVTKPRAKFKVTATRIGYFDLIRRRPGDTFYMEMEIGKGDEPVHMPSWVVLTKDYIPEDEEGTKPAKKRNAPDFIKL